MRCIVISILFLFAFTSFCQEKILLTDPRIQLECLEAVDSMYNFNFEVAEKQYNWLRQKHPEHPLPYFLLGLNEWWKILPNEYVKDYDKTFEDFMGLAIQKAKVLYKENKLNPEATFFLSASYGFKARLNAERGNYPAATLNAKKSLNYMLENQEANPDLVPEFMFGTALYNYFRGWVPENKKFMKPVLIMFPKGDKELGIEQLEEVSTESFYTRIEAMRYLIKIYSTYEKEYYKAWEYIKYLHKLYPKNAYFTRTFVKIAFKTRKNTECIQACKEAIIYVENHTIGYESETGRICSYILGYYYDQMKQYNKASFHFKECLRYTELPNAYSTGYTVLGVQKLAEYAIQKSDYQAAFRYYLKIKELSKNKKNESFKEAKKYIKKNKKEYKKSTK
jgi:hypothetical protein